MDAWPLKYLDVLVLHRAHAPCMHEHVARAQHDVAMVYIQCEPCHHDVIGIHIQFVPCSNEVA